jgi:hypothetical protein
MKTIAIAATILAVSTSFAVAEVGNQNDHSISGTEMRGSITQGGSTDMPKAKPMEGSLSGKSRQYSSGGGSTAMPNVKPEDGSLVSKEMHDAPGAQK